jgi:hypothetical protein
MAKSRPPDEPKSASGNFTEEAISWFYAEVRKGRNPYKVAEQIGASRASARKWMHKVSGRYIDGEDLTPLQVRNRMYEGSDEFNIGDIKSVVIPAPITRFEDLSDQAKQGYSEFGHWRTRYMGRRHIPWQVEMGHMLMAWHEEAVKENERLRGILNTPPGGGKTTTVTHDFPGWLICRNRNIRTALGSRTTPQATAYSRRLRNTLEKNTLLNVDFGLFKPEDTEVWRQDEFIVDGVTGSAASLEYKLALAGFDFNDPHIKRRLENPDDELWAHIKAVEAVWMAGEKESTVKALSQQMGFLGGRFDISLWDDLVDDKNSKTPEMRDGLATWWEEYAVSRAEPGGIVALVGTRFGKYDLFRHCRDMTYSTDEDFEDLLMGRLMPGMTEEQIVDIKEDLAKELVDKYGVPYDELMGIATLTPDENGLIQPKRIQQRVYRYVKYPAHDDHVCTNPLSMKQIDHIDCLLDPTRFKWPDLVKAREANPRKYALTYNQEDESTEDNLIQEVWLTGGVGDDGIMYSGCYNYNRTLLKVPELLETRDDDGYMPRQDCYSIATVDPSAVNWWSIQWWIWDAKKDTDYLMDILRVRIAADSFLSYSTVKREYHGIMDMWQKRSRDMNWPISLWIIEQNAAQRYLFQHTWVKEWMKDQRVHIKGHESDPTKADEDFGVQILRPRYREARVDLPYSQDDMQTRLKVAEFKTELTEYPDSPTDDMVHGHWFLEANRYKIPPSLKVPTAGVSAGMDHPYQDSMPPRLVQETQSSRLTPEELAQGPQGHSRRRRSTPGDWQTYQER